jgi:hypothetical protein
VIIPVNRPARPEFQALPRQYGASLSATPGSWVTSPNAWPVEQTGIPWCALLLGGLVVAGIALLTSKGEPKPRYCGTCGRSGHTRPNCSYAGSRVNFSRSIPKGRRCECCGQSRYETQRHHPHGRADASDRLDLCGDCHIKCGHDGNYQNPAKKPRVCRIMNRTSAWCG